MHRRQFVTLFAFYFIHFIRKCCFLLADLKRLKQTSTREIFHLESVVVFFLFVSSLCIEMLAVWWIFSQILVQKCAVNGIKKEKFELFAGDLRWTFILLIYLLIKHLQLVEVVFKFARKFGSKFSILFAWMKVAGKSRQPECAHIKIKEKEAKQKYVDGKASRK